jgi:psiF repeat
LRKNIAPRKHTDVLHSSAVQHDGATVPAPPFLEPEVHLMTISSRLAAAVGASFLLFATPVFAQATAAPAAKSDADAAATKGKKAQTPESLECSKEADAKGLHGKERKKFRSECKKAAMTGKKQ